MTFSGKEIDRRNLKEKEKTRRPRERERERDGGRNRKKKRRIKWHYLENSLIVYLIK